MNAPKVTADYILDFAATHKEFTLMELEQYVRRRYAVVGVYQTLARMNRRGQLIYVFDRLTKVYRVIHYGVTR